MKTSHIDSSPFEEYGYNLTRLAQQGAFSPLMGYRKMVEKVFQILLQKEQVRNKCNPLLLDLNGIRRWQVVVEVARRMATGEAPDALCTRQIIALNYEALFANASVAHKSPSSVVSQQTLPDENAWKMALDDSGSEEMIEQLLTKYFARGWWPPLEKWNAPTIVLSRLQTFFLALRESEGQIVLFVNHFHWLSGGEQSPYSVDASHLLKPVLERREIQLIGACTPDQYRTHIEYDAAISRRLQECIIQSDQEF